MREHVQDEIDRSRKQQTSEAFTGVLSDLINKSYSGAIGSAYQARARREEGYQRALRDRELKYEDQTDFYNKKPNTMLIKMH